MGLLEQFRHGLRYGIVAVWLVNGMLCKVMNLVPRHEAIVSRILGATYAAPITKLIGLAEIGMAIWVLSKRWVKLNTATQIGLVLTMNVLEYHLAADLLLWHGWNLVFAGLFALLLYYYGFRLSAGAYKHK
ncbi:DoxX-like family protein [Hymenobacter guriensis]|uniref:DoxX-like family protein n=1 Tax=Hymenobacter guriensis TaxID=2793065 RepID=A0ABS0L714_9BACT|nr:DoxX-like family protein [Hymenobacter guriensis]MBG8555926.1 DoxX-like family protein [Hymenobacter guriensis]